MASVGRSERATRAMRATTSTDRRDDLADPHRWAAGVTLPDLPLVVSSGVCVGCGACAVAAPEQIAMQLTERGTYSPSPGGRELAELDEQVALDASKVCPFSNTARDEDAIGADCTRATAHPTTRSPATTARSSPGTSSPAISASSGPRGA